MASPYPLVFEPILKEKVWGGHRLERYSKVLRPGSRIGESWEIADLSSTATGGGGGEPARSVIANGPLAGKTLHDAIDAWGKDLLGEVSLSDAGEFPLLVKFLDAQENLSVQVHPSPAYAEANPGAHLKTEAWVVVEAEAGSVIYSGLRDGVTREDFERALRTGSGEGSGGGSGGGVVGLLQRVPAVVGECHLLPSGTVHALGAGVLVLEVQTPSDTTFRVYDWATEYGRAGRELHIDEALACADIGPAPLATSVSPGETGGRLCKTKHFDLWSQRLAVDGEMCLDWAHGRCVGIACVSGRLELRSGAAAGGGVLTLARGGVALIPASALGGWRVVAMEVGGVVGFGVG